jgi:hypothetical protein
MMPQKTTSVPFASSARHCLKDMRVQLVRSEQDGVAAGQTIQETRLHLAVDSRYVLQRAV